MVPKQAALWVLNETDTNKDELTPVPSAEKRVRHIVWQNVILFFMLHLGALYGAYLFLAKAMWMTSLFAVFLYVSSGLGISAGAHRLWSHKSYKARLPLRILLTFFNTVAFQDSILDWARNHRMHHKYSETDADPHNPTRGFFFSHIGWLLVKKHPEIKAKGHTIDLSDLWADPILRFQKKYYIILMPIACFILPAYIPTLWGESVWNSYFVSAVFRYVYLLNVTWFINSIGHKWGNKPYDKRIKPGDIKTLSLFVLGEGFHNFHHTFPWDYKSAELGDYSLNISKVFIEIMEKIGWAYDLKTVLPDVLENRVKRTGDGTHKQWFPNSPHRE